ncbi:MAG TPA: colanic acid biosynthesis acetyltransferase WcaF [Phycisphaerales bacterium]|nr:colanic acid biosynthesis acetyltransferase WcaF [Phycisphaerales bacterium]
MVNPDSRPKSLPANKEITRPRRATALVHGLNAKQRLTETLWELVGQPVFRITFHNWYGLRNRILRAFGADIHPTARIRPTARIAHPWQLKVGANTAIGDYAILYCLGPISIGRCCTVSQYSHLCAASHDFTRADMQLLTPGITIADDAWIAADTFVGPGVNVGEGAILGARASAFKDLEPWTIYGGDTAKKLGTRTKLPPIPDQAKHPE